MHAGILRRSHRKIMLASCLLAAGVVALSIHVGLLAAGVPFPFTQPPIWGKWLNLSIIMAGTMTFLGFAGQNFCRFGFVGRTLITCVVLAALQETLRVALMTFVVTGGWIQPIIGLVSPLCRTLVTASVCVAASRWLQSRPRMIVSALFLAAFALALHLLLGSLLTPITEYAAQHAKNDLYQFPYPLHVTFAAYVTFMEAVAGTTLMTWLIWDQLPPSRATRLGLLALLTASMKGVIGGTFVFGFFTASSVWIGMLSWSQFLLEFVALGVLVGFSWERFGAADPQPKM